jgi:hypothetical protein
MGEGGEDTSIRSPHLPPLSPCSAEPSSRARAEASSAEASSAEPFPSAEASSVEPSPSTEKNPSAEPSPSAEAAAIGNDGQTAMLVMDTHDEGDNGQIAGARGNGSRARDGHVQQGQLQASRRRARWPRAAKATADGVHGEWDQNNNHPTTDGGVRWRWKRMTMHQSN